MFRTITFYFVFEMAFFFHFLTFMLMPAINAEQKLQIDLDNLSVSEILKNIRNGINCSEIMRFFLNRIEMYDKIGPKLNAIIMINPNLTNEAENLDDFYYRSRGRLKGLLHCVPVLVKDIIPVKGMPTTFGK